jgi:RNAse (barnase) inhibitor barstar
VSDDVKNLARELADVAHSGVYLLARDPAEVERAAMDAGLAVFRIDIAATTGKKDFLKRIAEVLKFPEHFGYNWDALNDSLSDLEWLSIEQGAVLIFDGVSHYAARHKDDFNSAIQVLISASDYWKEQGRPFWVFIHGSQKADYGLPSW